MHVEAVYHEECKTRFFLDKEAPPPPKPKGHPKNPVMVQHFNMLCAWSEETTELDSMKELYNQMKEFAGDSEEDVYSMKRLGQKLKQRYKGFIQFTERVVQSNIVCFKNTPNLVINDQWYTDRENCPEDELERIVISSAKIVKAKIREQ